MAMDILLEYEDELEGRMPEERYRDIVLEPEAPKEILDIRGPMELGKGVVTGLLQTFHGLGGAFPKWLGEIGYSPTLTPLPTLPPSISGPMLEKFGDAVMQYTEAALSDPAIARPDEWQEPLEVGEFFDNPTENFWRVGRIISEAAPSLGTAMLVSAATGQPWLGATVLGIAEGAPQYIEARELGKSIPAASMLGLASTVGTTLLEYLPLRTIEKMGGKNLILSMLASGTVESTQEALQTIYQNSIAHFGYDETRKITEGLFESIIAGFGTGGPAGAFSPQYRAQMEKRRKERVDASVDIELTPEMEEAVPPLELVEEREFPPTQEMAPTEPGLYIRRRTETPTFESIRGAQMNLKKAEEEVGKPHEVVQIMEKGERIGWGLYAAPAVPTEEQIVTGLGEVQEELFPEPGVPRPTEIAEGLEEIAPEIVPEEDPEERRRTQLIGLEPTEEDLTGDPWTFQDRFGERAVKVDWKEANSVRYVLEGAGDILRSFAGIDPSPGYITEKLRRINSYLAEREEGRQHRLDSIEQAEADVPEVVNKLIELYEQQPTRTDAQMLAKRLVLALAQGNDLGARELVTHIEMNLRALVDTGRVAEAAPEPPEGVEVPPTPPGEAEIPPVEAEVPERPDIGTADNLNVSALSAVFLADIEEGAQYRGKLDVERRVAQILGMERRDLQAQKGYLYKPVEEAFEYAIVSHAKDIILEETDIETTYDRLKELYESQPLLAQRTGVSTKLQQFSTPVHLAYLMQMIAGVTETTTIYEPTAGTGMLVTAANPEQVTANEIDTARADILRAQGVPVTEEDAIDFVATNPILQNDQDIVLANPPFGKIPGELTREIEGYKISKIEHAIMMDALKAMTNEGRAVFLIGDHNFDNGKMKQNQRIFLNWLYRNYNVTQNIDIPGREYRRQGTSFPVRLIVIEGRKAEPAGLAPFYKDDYQSVDSIDDLVGMAMEVQGERRAVGPEGVTPVPVGGEGVRPTPVGEVEGEPGELPTPPVGEAVPPSEEAPEGRPGEPVGQPPAEGVGPAPEPEPGRPVGEPVGPRGVEEAPPTPVGEPEREPEPERPEGEPRPEERPTPEREREEDDAGTPEPTGISGTVDDALEDDTTSGLAEATEEDIDDLLDGFGEDDAVEEPVADSEVPPDQQAPPDYDSALDAIGDMFGLAEEEEVEQVLPFRSQEDLLGSTVLATVRPDPPAGFDERKYVQLQPILNAAWKKMQQQGVHWTQFPKVLTKDLRERFGDKVKLKELSPYVKRFMVEMQERQKPQQITEDEYQITYIPTSEGPIIEETMMPRKMRESVLKALTALEKKVGNIDAFVRDALGYDSKADLYKAFAADQIDALALALDNIQKGEGMIVGDGTGVGKGRIAAALLDWARRQGKVPIFFTEKANLFTDIWRDIKDIARKFNPFIMADSQAGIIYDAEGKIVHRPLSNSKRRAFIRKLSEQGAAALGEYDVVLTNYSQINHPSRIQRGVIERLGPDNIVILDESHNAAGDSNTGDFMRERLQEVEGVVYLSATYAKRPDNMAIYFRTAISKANLSLEDLIDAIKRGGEPLQEIMASALAKLGQYIRREKSFRGISVPTVFDTENTERDTKRADQMTSHFRAIMAFDEEVAVILRDWSRAIRAALSSGRPIPADIQAFLDAIGVTPEVQVSGRRATATSLEKTTFAATYHNAVSQLLLSMKTDFAIEQAKKALDEGKKPFLGVQYTMGTFFEDAVEADVIKEGEEFDLTFSDVVMTHLGRTLRVRVKKPTGVKYTVRFPLSALPAELQTKYTQIERQVAATHTDMPFSPLDELKKQLQGYEITDPDTGEKRGAVVGELTARHFVVDLETGELTRRTGNEIADRNRVINGFNSGKIDVIIANAAGATGASLHASTKFKDQRVRHYIGWQPDHNVSTEVQKMGRIHRKDQVVIPTYEALRGNIPAEIRPAAIHMRKMKSLSANTSANVDSALAQTEIPDMMNKYGDDVVEEWAIANRAQAESLGVRFTDAGGVETATEGLMRRLSGRVALWPVSEQKGFYETIEDGYTDMIRQLKEAGEYDLEVEDLDFKAETIETQLLIGGTDEAHPFGRATFLEKLKVRALRKPYKENQLKEFIQRRVDKMYEAMDKKKAEKIMAQEGLTPNQLYVQRVLDRIEQDLDEYVAQKKTEGEARRVKAAQKALAERKEEEAVAELLDAEGLWAEEEANLRRPFEFLKEELEGRALGDSTQISEFRDSAEYRSRTRAVLIDVVYHRGKGNPARHSGTTMIFAVNDFRQRVSIPLSQLNVRWPSEDYTKNWNEYLPTEGTEEIWMITGNLLQGFAEAPPRSRVVRFTTLDGTIREGILPPRTYDPGREATSITLTADQAVTMVLEDRAVQGKAVNWLASYTPNRDKTRFRVQIAPARKTGGIYYQDERLQALTEAGTFEARTGQPYYGYFSRENVRPALLRMVELGEAFKVDRSVFSEVFPDDVSHMEGPGGGPRGGVLLHYVGEPTLSEIPETPSDEGTRDHILGNIGMLRPSFMSLPEIVHLAKMLLEGKPIAIKKKLRAAKGRALGTFNVVKGNIQLRADIFKDIKEAAAVLAHEIGHLVDWLPDKTVKRGGILNRILTLKHGMHERAMELASDAEIRNELKAWTHIWSPFDEAADRKYTQYRYESVELYAEAISGLINNPDLLREVAPNFYRGFFEYLYRKPQVRAAYEEIQDDIRGGLSMPKLVKRIFRGFRKYDEAHYDRMKRAKGWLDTLKSEMIDIHHGVIKRIRMIGESNILNEDNPRYALEEMGYSGSEVELYISDFVQEVWKPLREKNVSWDEFNAYLLYRRIIFERKEMGNPFGIDPETAKKLIDEMFAGMTPEQVKQVQDSQKAFWKWRQFVIDKVDAQGVYGKELMHKIKNNEVYATFDVVRYITDKYGGAAGLKIYPQVGTFEDVGPPATATLMKDIGMIRGVNRQIAAEKVVAFMDKYYPGEIEKARTKWNGTFHEIQNPTDANQGLIVVLKNGKAKGYYVPTLVAKSFEHNPYETSAITVGMGVVSQVFRKLFTEWNPGFWLFNINRDYWRAVKLLPKANVLNFTGEFLKGLKAGFGAVYGVPDETVRAMLEGKMLLSVANWKGAQTEDRTIEKLLRMWHIQPKEWDRNVRKPIGKFMNYFSSMGIAYEKFGRISERGTKIAAYNYLVKTFPDFSKQEIGHMVRVWGGSPDFLRRGRAYPLYNNIFLFSNAMKEGYRGTAEIIEKDRKSAMSYGWKVMKYTMIPKFLMALFSWGLMGDEWEEVMDGVSDYDKTNYTIIPLGLDARNNSVFLRLPSDEESRFLGGLLWKAMEREKPDALTGMFDYMAGQAPTLNPIIELMAAAQQYASGKNPYDWFRGRYIMPEYVFDAYDWNTHETFAKWVWNNSGMGMVYRFPSSDIETIKSDFQKVTGYPIVVDNLIGRFLKIGKRGKAEKLRWARQKEHRERAREIVRLRKIMSKVVNEEEITRTEYDFLAENADYFNRNIQKFLHRRAGRDLTLETLTGTKRERAAVIRKLQEMQERYGWEEEE